MLAWTEALACIAILLGVLWWFLGQRSTGPSLSHIPGPSGYPIVGNTFQINMERFRIQLSDWSDTYGPVMKLKLLVADAVILSGYEAQNEALVTNTNATGGRPVLFRQGLYSEHSGIVFNEFPDDRWRLLRKVSHRHVKQFGDGLQHIEQVVFDVSDDMFSRFHTAADDKEAIDPLRIIRGTALKIIAYLIVGKRLHDEDYLFQVLSKLEPMVWSSLTLGADEYLMMDAIPAMFHLPSKGRRNLLEMMAAKEKFIAEIVNYTDSGDNLMNSLMQEARKKSRNEDNESSSILNERDPALTSLNMIIAGLATTSMTFYTFLNVLAQHRHVQEQIRAEINKVVPKEDENVTLQYRADLHYTRAALFEILRYFTVTPIVPHKATKDTRIQGVFIPSGTQLLINLWGLHHEKRFWGDPECFRPERFLHDDGTLVAVDHPNRRHLRPFGAGVRVCVGEQMALARLFLWTANLLRRFEILPAEGSTKTSADPRTYKDSFALLPTNYKIFLKTCTK